MDSQHDVVVIGVGGMGSATVAALARRGVDVLGLERYDVPHAEGSSHGVTRILRLPQYEDPAYVPLVRRALDLWEDLDADHDTDLFHRTGTLDVGPPEGTVYPGSKASCDRHGLAHQVVTGRDLSERVGGYDLPPAYRAVYQPDGGFLHAEQCTVAHAQRAHEHGGTIRARERVVGWEAGESGVAVSTDRRDYAAETLVVTAGAWTGQLLPALDGVLAPERQVLGWFQPADPGQFAPARFPAFVAEVPEGYYYGCPVYGVPGVKLGKHHHQGETGTPTQLRRDPTQEDEEVLREFLDGYLPAGAGPTMGLSTCLYTNTPDGDFVVDSHPDHPNVVVGAGFSGRGFKFASVVGEILADLAADGTTDHPVDRFGLDRFE
jgi:sarcosine oxidase